MHRRSREKAQEKFRKSIDYGETIDQPINDSYLIKRIKEKKMHLKKNNLETMIKIRKVIEDGNQQSFSNSNTNIYAYSNKVGQI